MRTLAVWIGLAAACAPSRHSSHDPTPRAPSPRPAPPAAAASALAIDAELVFEGACDASGAVELDATHFVVADDEDNVLRVYDAVRGGPPVAAVDVSAALGLAPQGKRAPRMPELDLEAATRIGDRAYWLTSHGRNSKGKARPERLRFFATTLPAAPSAAGLDVVASSDRLLEALLADPRLARFDLATAATRAPKAEGGLNLEGMTASPDGALLLGFRSPVPDGRALLVRLERPDDFLAGGAAALGPPVQLDLGGHGVRALTWWQGRYALVAGPADTGGPARLYAWDGAGAAAPLAVDLTGYNPEGTFSPDGDPRLLLLSDDGTALIDGVACKATPDPARRRFRGVWLRAR
ncbi:MAG: DUF3616 domain-containing protein [Myxococcales bacterium]|nr:DUF3616 domain-containing protein [Myxococcales bacterium]